MRVISSIDVFYRTYFQWDLQKLANSYCAGIGRLVSELEQSSTGIKLLRFLIDHVYLFAICSLFVVIWIPLLSVVF